MSDLGSYITNLSPTSWQVPSKYDTKSGIQHWLLLWANWVSAHSSGCWVGLGEGIFLFFTPIIMVFCP